MLTPDEMYVEAVRHIHERLVDLLVVTTVVIDNPRRAPRLKHALGLELWQLQATVRETLKVIEG